MISAAVLAISASFIIFIVAYLVLSKHEGSNINILTPSLVMSIPAYYLFPLAYLNLFGPEGSTYSHFWVYSALALEPLIFVVAYMRTGNKVLRLPGASAYANFGLVSL